jgi:hypothetical protein
MVMLPRAARLAAWSTVWLHGDADLSEVLARVSVDDEPHDAVEVPGASDRVPLKAALEALRAEGARALRVSLPAPGDPTGLGGPPELTVDAIEAGEATLAVGAPYALVPDVRTFGPPGDEGHLVTWRCRPAAPPPAGPSLPEAEHALTVAIGDAGAELARLDVAAWRPEVATLLDDIRTAHIGEPLPRTFPARAQGVAARSVRIMAVVGFALDDDGGAITASSAASRRAALAPLARAARHALMAACNVLAP